MTFLFTKIQIVITGIVYGLGHTILYPVLSALVVRKQRWGEICYSQCCYWVLCSWGLCFSFWSWESGKLAFNDKYFLGNGYLYRIGFCLVFY